MNSLSFVIITDGNKPAKLLNQIQSIRYQKINNYEIIISGNPNNIFYNQSDIQIVEDKDSAVNGNLSAMRNKACNIATKENIIISDDDMLFSLNWYATLSSYNQSFDILTPQVKLPDGTRFWDYCCYKSPVNGHKILEKYESDTHLYMSGGQSWVMKKQVFDNIKWNEDLGFYNALKSSNVQNEDTDFSERCRKYGYTISHYHNLIVYHDDITYSGFGRNMSRRKCKDFSWIFLFDKDHELLKIMSKYLYDNEYYAESIDIMRLISIKYPESSASLMRFLSNFENHYGGKLSDSNCIFNNPEYNEILKSIYEK